MPVDAFVTLLEAFFIFFVRTHTHRDTKALLYPCCTCARRVTTSYLSVYVVAKNTGNTDDHKTDSIALWTERLTTRRTTRQIHCKAIAQPSFAHMHVLGNNAHQILTGWFNNDSILKKFSWVFSRICLLERECQSCRASRIQSTHTHTPTHTVAQTLLWV